MSLVRSNSAREAGRLLADWRRVNVAVTRARAKLVHQLFAFASCCTECLVPHCVNHSLAVHSQREV